MRTRVLPARRASSSCWPRFGRNVTPQCRHPTSRPTSRCRRTTEYVPTITSARKFPLAHNELSGVLFVDKPVGITSHDLVAVVRRAAKTQRVGHAGTLGPFASGLLVVAVGPCTRLLPYFAGEPKVYDALIRFGRETDTDDVTGQTTGERDVPDFAEPHVQTMLGQAIASLTGHIAQVPPAYSAKQVDGQRAYALARRGTPMALSAVDVTVHEWTALRTCGADVHARITCAGGTYVRALARDLGRAMDSAAHCVSLRRERSGPADVRDAVNVSALSVGAVAEGRVALRSPLELLDGLAREWLSDNALRDLAHGRAIAATADGPRAVLLAMDCDAQQPVVVGIGTRTADDRWQPKVVLRSDAS